MKHKYLKLIIFTLTCLLLFTNHNKRSIYDPSFVTVTKSIYNNESYTTISMNRKDKRIKAKYFTASSNGKSVYQRYLEWSKGKNVILLTSAGYIDRYNERIPEGLTIDDGKLINRSIEKGKFDALVIIYPSQGGGGIVVSNLIDGNLNATCNNYNRSFNLRNNQDDFEDFIECANNESFTVFQTHLLVYKNELKLFNNSSNTKQERRFLAVGTTNDGNTIHAITQHPIETTLKEGAQKVFNFLKDKKGFKDIVFMINLDTGRQDVFRFFDKNGNKRDDIIGSEDPSKAINLLVYYFE
jgi:hypothetical protein